MIRQLQNLFAMLLASPLAAWAEEAHHAAAEHAVHVPTRSIFVQTLNVVLLLGVLIYLTRKTIVAHFKHRAEEYAQLVRRAQAAKDEAERGHREIKERLDKLESGAEASLAQARREADEMKKKMIAEAGVVSERLKTEAQRTVATEVEKAKAELRADLLQSALATSQEVLKSSLSSSEQTKLQNEFVQKMVGR